MAPTAGEFYTGGVRIAYRCQGSGPLLLILPGVGASQLALLEQIPDSRLFLTKQGDHPLMWNNAGEFRRAADAFLQNLSMIREA
jgi:pimeloyl-ACP methyl ester carboxylesterase